jgi:hypothetical protein
METSDEVAPALCCRQLVEGIPTYSDVMFFASRGGMRTGSPNLRVDFYRGRSFWILKAA